jgi:cyanophycinase-like exopeptidase
MGLADVTWTPAGFRQGLGLVRGFLVVPHFEQFDAQDRAADVAEARARGLAAVGLDERTGVLREAPGQWRVAGAGRAAWIPADGSRFVAAHGELLPIPA